MARFAPLACAAAVACLAGCGSDRATRGEGTIEVVATTWPVADIVRNAGGRRVRVVVVIPRTADPHRRHPSPSALDRAREADLVVRGGGALDGWAAGLADRVLELMPRVAPGRSDPHWWIDPVRVERAVKEIRNELARADVHGAGYYEASSADFLERLRRLHDATEDCLALVAEARKAVPVDHLGFAHFTARYGVEFTRVGRAGEERRLWSDTLGPPGSGRDSYLGAMAANVATIVDALSGGRRTCRPRP